MFKKPVYYFCCKDMISPQEEMAFHKLVPPISSCQNNAGNVLYIKNIQKTNCPSTGADIVLYQVRDSNSNLGELKAS